MHEVCLRVHGTTLTKGPGLFGHAALNESVHSKKSDPKVAQFYCVDQFTLTFGGGVYGSPTSPQ